MYARAGYAEAPYGGTVLPAPDVGALPPPIPGDPGSFSYAPSVGAYPWSYISWAGGYPLPTYPGGGVLVHPSAATGVMELTVWWPDAPVLQLVRIGQDGTRIPVRGGYPLIVTTTTATRRNYCTNPSVEIGLNGFVPDAGSPTLTQLAMSPAPAGDFVLRATNAGSGSNGVTVPTGLAAAPAGRPVTVGWSMRCSARPTSVTMTIGWADSGGGALATNSVVLTADEVNESVDQFGRQVVTVIPPDAAATPTLKITAGGMPAGGTMDLDAIVFEIRATDGSPFDGTSLGAAWAGTAGLSASVLAPVLTVLDGECPLDTHVTYQVSYPSITGGRVVSDPATLASNGKSWFTHPRAAGSPIRIDPSEVPVLQRDIDQGVFWPIGARHPMVVSAAQRRAATGELALNTDSFAERDVLRGYLSDSAPLLYRAPAEYGYGPGSWLALGNVTEDRGGRRAWQDATLVTASFVEVDAPAPDFVA